jgi:uncharacterized repeat protein (TIGR01451 family)
MKFDISFFQSKKYTTYVVALVAVALCFSNATDLLAQRPFTCEDQFFLTLSTMPPSLNEVIIDPQTNAARFDPINNNLAIDVNATGYRSTDNYIYSINTIDRILVRIDANGTTVPLANLALNPQHSYFAGDITPDGRYLLLLGTAFFQNGSAQAADLVRVDLEDPNFGLTVQNIGTFAQIYDIAFHPVTNDLFGYDSGSQRLVRINAQTGAISFPFPPNDAPTISGSLFFDAYGQLFAYGSPDDDTDQNSLYEIDPNTGVATFLTSGATAVSSDGCSCPYTVELSKSVKPKQSYPCADVEYTFELVNTSNRVQMGLRLEDQLPAGFTFVSVSANPLGGTVLSQPGDNVFILDDVNLPDGRFEVKIIVNVGAVPAGRYRNQAELFNLPPALGDTRLSDDRTTLVLDDSTEITILRFDFDTLYTEVALCAGAVTVPLDARDFANIFPDQVTYTWQDGSTRPIFDAPATGQYIARLGLGCDSAFVIFEVIPSAIDIDILTADGQTIRLGESLILEGVVNSSHPAQFEWIDPEPTSITCTTCLETEVRPFNDVSYQLISQNSLGCRDSATLRVFVQKNRAVFFPNVFSPISDNQGNSYFYPSGDEFTEVARLQVFTRWGEIVYDSGAFNLNDVTRGWDGTHRGQYMQPGVYVWHAQIQFLDGVESRYSGDVLLLR